MNFTYNIQNTSYSFRPNAHNYHCLDWGPNGLLGIAFENFVSICDSTNFNVLCTFNLHKSNIACIRFSPVSVERSYANSFQSLIAVGDETGNCLIYDIFNGVRHAGFSPEKLPVTPIIDIQWNQSNPSMLFILTAAPSIICVSIGSATRRHYSCVQSWSQIGQSLQSFNLNFVFSVPLASKFQFILTDQFHTSQLLVASTTGNYYSLVRLQNGRQQPIATAPLQFNGLPNDQKILSIECFPHNLNRLTIVMEHSIYVYDLIAKTASLIYRHNLSSFSPMTNVFSASVSNRFWIAISDGNVSSFTIQGENFVREFYVLIPQFYQMCQFSVDPYKPSRFAVCTLDGKIAIFSEHKKKLMCTAYRPSFPDNISSMTSDNDKRYAFVTNQGYVGLFDTFSGKRYRFRIDIEKFEGVNFTHTQNVRYNSIVFSGKNLTIGGNGLFTIDTDKRVISLTTRHFAPTKLMSIGSVIACTPFPNTLDIIFPNMPKRTLTFTGTIICFNSRMADPNRWALIVRGCGICIVDISQKPKMVGQFATNDEAACCILYIGSFVYVATRIGELIRLNIDTKQTVSLKICGCMIRSMKSYESFILISDVENNTYLIDTKQPQFKVSRAPKWKIYEGFFITATITQSSTSPSLTSNKDDQGENGENNEQDCDGKETVTPLSNYETLSKTEGEIESGPFRTMAVVQTSLTTFMIVALPSFEICMAPSITYSSKLLKKSDITARFASCIEIADFEKVALEAGDLDFVQFVRTLRRLHSLPLPALYTQNHVEFVAKERMTRLIERETQPYNLIDFFILSNETKSAARLLMQIDSGCPMTSVLSTEKVSQEKATIGAMTVMNKEGSELMNNSIENDEVISKSGSEVKKASSSFFIPSLRSRKSFSAADSPSISSYASTSLTGNASLLFSGVDSLAMEKEGTSEHQKGGRRIGMPFTFGKTSMFGGLIGNSSDFSSPSLSNLLGGRGSEAPSSSEADRNESDLLLAYACLAPNIEAARLLAAGFAASASSSSSSSALKARHVQTIAKLFCIAGDREAAIHWLAANNDWTSALYYLKILYSDDENVIEYDEEEDEIEEKNQTGNKEEDESPSLLASTNDDEYTGSSSYAKLSEESTNNLSNVKHNDEESTHNSSNINESTNDSSNIKQDEKLTNDLSNVKQDEKLPSDLCSSKLDADGRSADFCDDKRRIRKRKKRVKKAEEAQIEIISSWLKQKPIQLSPLILIFIGDYHAALSILYKNGSVAKAHVLIMYLKRKNIEIKQSSFTDYVSLSVDEIVNKIETRWNGLST